MTRVLAVALVVAGGCKADLPDITDKDGTLDARCVGPYADMVLDTNPKTLDGTPALGAPDTTSVTLGANGVLTVGLLGLGGVVDKNGADIRIHGSVAAGAMGIVHIAGADQMFEYTGDLSPNSTEIDMAVALSIPTAVYVRIINVTGSFTVDAVEAIQTTCR